MRHLTPDLDRTISKSQADQLARRSLRAIGYSDGEAVIIGDHLVDCALCGYDYAGLPRILSIAEHRKLVGPGQPMANEYETPTSAVLNGGNQTAYLVAYRAMEIALEKAAAEGIAAVSAYNGYYSGRNAYYLERICRAGFVGLHTGSAPAFVAPHGGIAPALGPNPIAFGMPRASGDPFIFDAAMSSMMLGDIEMCARAGVELPEGTVVDAQGRATTDAQAVLNGGAILPRGGHLGFGFMLTVQLLGLLAGLADDKLLVDRGWLFLIFSPDLFGAVGQSFPDRVDRLLREVSASRPADPNQPVRIPSERAFAMRRQRLETGVPINGALFDQLTAMASSGG